MRRTIYVLSLAALISFLIGLWYELGRNGHSPLRNRKAITLQVLAPAGVFPLEFRKELKVEENIDLQITEPANTKALLTEILKTNSPYQLVVFPSYLSDSLTYSEYFLPLNDVLGATELSELVSQISVDFLSLGKDPDNAYTVPLLWGVNGWLLPEGMHDDRLSLEDVMGRVAEAKNTLYLLPDPTEIFGVLTKIKPSVRAWVGTGQGEELAKETLSLQSRIKFYRHGELPTTGIRQISSGELDKTNREKFRLAEEKSHLWIQYMALKRGAPVPAKVLDVLSTLYTAEWSEKLALQSHMAHCGRALNGSKTVSENLKSAYIRQLPISRIELISNHEAYEPLFLNYLKAQYRSEFSQ